MILINKNITDNFIVMFRGFFYRISLVLVAFLIFSNNVFAAEKIGIITDTLLTPVNYYNAYYKTPEFFAMDIRSELFKRGVDVVPPDILRQSLKKAGITQNDLEKLTALQQGYSIDYSLLQKITKNTGISKIIIITMGMDIQRDFLKNTLWNAANVPGFDVVNPTHRVSVYAGYVDIRNENMLWESIYAKNLRNNKMKNLDTTVSSNYEGMLRLKEYSKYISPDIAYNVKMKTLNPNYVEPPAYITKENLKQYAKDKHNMGVKKELSEIDRQKWDTDKFINDSKENIKDATNTTKANIKKGANAAKENAIKAGNKTKNGYNSLKTKFKKKETIQSL